MLASFGTPVLASGRKVLDLYCLCAMSPTCPPNLTQSTAHLKDNPYDVQLGVLKWIRALVFEVIDQASTRAVLADKSSGEHGNAERMTLAQIGRKRPRTGTLHGRDGFRQGSVVECFHAVSGPFIKNGAY